MHVNKKILLFLLCQSLLIIHYAPHLCGTNKGKLYIERQPNAAPTVALYGRFNSFSHISCIFFYIFIFSVFLLVFGANKGEVYIYWSSGTMQCKEHSWCIKELNRKYKSKEFQWSSPNQTNSNNAQSVAKDWTYFWISFVAFKYFFLMRWQHLTTI